MSFWLYLACFVALQQADPVRPSILTVKYGLTGPLYTGRATGWLTRPERWNWCTVSVRNPLDRSLEAALRFRTVTAQSPGQYNLVAAVSLPARSDRRISFPVRSPYMEPTAWVRAAFRVELIADGVVQDGRETPASVLNETFHLLALAGGGEDLSYLIDGQTLFPNRGPQLQPQGVVRCLNLSDQAIPDDALGLDMIQTLIMWRPASRALRPLQWAALERWVDGGGHLILTPDPAAAPRPPGLEALLPILPVSERRATVLPSLAAWCGQPLEVPDTLSVSECLVRRGRVLLAEGDVPLLVRERRGFGSITYVAVHPDARAGGTHAAWRAFWLRLLRELDEPDPVDVPRLHAHIGALIERFVGREVVGVWLPLLLVAGYLITIATLLPMLGRARRASPRRWAAVCLAALAFAAAAQLSVRLIGGAAGDGLYDLWMVCAASGSGVARASDYLSVFPASRGERRLVVHGGAARPMPTSDRDPSVVNAVMRDAATELAFHAEKGKLRLLPIEGTVAGAGATVTGVADSSGLTFELANTTGYDLDASFLRYGRRVLPVGPLQSGARRAFRVGAAQGPSPFETYEAGPVLDSAARLRRSFLHALFLEPNTSDDAENVLRDERGTYQGTSSGTLFGGWAAAPLLPIDVGNGAKTGRTRALGLVLAVPSWRVAEDEFLIPKGGMVLSLPDPSARPYYYGKSVLRGDKPVSGRVLALVFGLPDWAGPAQIEAATLFLHFASDGFRVRATADGEPLELPEMPVGRFAVPLPASAGPRRALRIELEVEPRDRFAEEHAWEGQTWFLREVDLECRCRRESSAASAPSGGGTSGS